jgi:MOSC domain-containing protein YiiM
MFVVGPYRFTTTDATKTVQHHLDIIDGHRHRRTDGLFERLASPPTGDLETDVRRTWALFEQCRERLAAAGQLPLTATGRVAQINTSDGGVPKHPIPSGRIGIEGLTGDRQGNRQHHGRPWQAVCLWSVQVIDELRALGHPIHAGAAGENITIDGIDWAHVRPGVQLRIGSALCHISAYAVPCSKNSRWMADGQFSRLHHLRGEFSRVYAIVLQEGDVAVDDAVILEPEQETHT